MNMMKIWHCFFVDQISIGKKRSFFERIQDFQVKDKIQAVYRSMNKSRFRNKVKKEDEESLGFQGLFIFILHMFAYSISCKKPEY